ncbi:hypothetical protein [Nonomuraea sp. NPDC049158]|uniref:hypothetical protein n=1 Tax=Nonomuraea sp. NPDC049158 TaxID=3155649 RepID=UPI0033CCCD58
MTDVHLRLVSRRDWGQRSQPSGEGVVGAQLLSLGCDDFVDGGAGGGFVDDALVGGEGGQQGLEGEVVDRAGIATAGGVGKINKPATAFGGKRIRTAGSPDPRSRSFAAAVTRAGRIKTRRTKPSSTWDSRVVAATPVTRT